MTTLEGVPHHCFVPFVVTEEEVELEIAGHGQSPLDFVRGVYASKGGK